MNQKLNRMPTRVASSLIPWAAGGGGDFVEPELHKYIVFTYIHAYRQCMLVYSTVLFSVQLDSFYCFHVFYGPVGASLTPSLAPLSTEIRHIFVPNGMKCSARCFYHACRWTNRGIQISFSFTPSVRVCMSDKDYISARVNTNTHIHVHSLDI